MKFSTLFFPQKKNEKRIKSFYSVLVTRELSAPQPSQLVKQSKFAALLCKPSLKPPPAAASRLERTFK